VIHHLFILLIRCLEIRKFLKIFKIVKEYVILRKLGFDKPNFFYEKIKEKFYENNKK